MSNVDKNKVDEKIESEKPCAVAIDTSSSVSLRHLENPTDKNQGGTGEGVVLVMQESMTDTDVAKVDTNAKADNPDASNASNASKIDTPKIDVKIGILKPDTKRKSDTISTSRHFFLIN